MKLSALFIAIILISTISQGSEIRWLVTLSDESRIFANPTSPQISLQSAYLGKRLAVPVESIQTVSKTEDGEWQVTLANHDRLSGKLMNKFIELDSLIGDLEISPKHIQRIKVVDHLPEATESEEREDLQIHYGGFDWDLWRTGWEVQEGGNLASTRSVRPGFAYGHWANGRGGMAITGNGDGSWRNYEVKFNYRMLPATREFFHAHIPGESRGMVVFFRAKSLTESWNEPDTAYGLAINPSGTWTLLAYEGWHMPGNGWSSTNRKGLYEKLLTGKLESSEDIGAGQLRLRVEGNQFQAWINKEKLFDFSHDSGEIEPIPYGGFGVQWRYESMGVIENLKVQKFAAPVN